MNVYRRGRGKNMKRTKVLTALLTAAALMMGTCATAMAADAPTVDVKKKYSLLNEGTEAPAETFKFTVVKEKAENSSWTADEMPMLQHADGTEATPDNVTITYDGSDGKKAAFEGTEQTVHLKFPVDGNTKPGQYTYKITETAGSTAGTVYDNKTIHAKVTVLNGADGVYVDSVSYTVDGGKLGDGEGFVNQYQAAKELKIKKEVTGNLGDTNKYFEVKVTLRGEDGKTVPQTFTVTGGSNASNPATITTGTETTFLIKHGETLTIANVPYGVTYTVQEKSYTGTDEGGYDAAKYTLNNVDKGTTSISDELVDADTEEVRITNNKGTQIDTGVVLDNLPYVILLAVVIGAAMAWFFRRRTSMDGE